MRWGAMPTVSRPVDHRPSRCAARRARGSALSVVVRPEPLRPSSVTTSPSATLEVHAVEDVRLAVEGVQVR